MPRNKNETLSIRTTADIKDLLRHAADRAHRTIAHMVEVMIRDYCGAERRHDSRTGRAV